MRVFRGFMMALADSVPGVSGGTVAFLMGFYDALIGALLGFVRLLNRALKRRRAQVMYAVLGMMAASLYVVVMRPTTLDVPQPALSAGNFSILWFLTGCGVIAAFLGFERAANRKAARR